jgi:ABC-type nitrate/sulfonate/bicarbonate transport system permease component
VKQLRRPSPSAPTLTPRRLGDYLRHDLLLRPASFASLLAAWLLLAFVMGPQVLPGPVDTLAFLWQQLERGTLPFHVWVTVQRVLIAFGAAMLLGVALGVAMGALRWLDRLLEAWLIVGLTIPRIVLFVVAYLLIGLSDFAAIVALIVTVLPTIVVQLREGTRALDPRLLEMARAYRRSPWAIWRQVVFPQLLPYFIGTARAALSLSWKMVVLAELLGRTSGVGYQISFYFQMFNMRGILAYGLAMMVILALIDLGFMGLMQRYAFRWRRPVRLS